MPNKAKVFSIGRRAAEYSHLGYCVLALLLAAKALLMFPIMMVDSDLWYHLNAGRYFWEHGKIPAASFFSFLAPPREFVNYYWLFQVIIFKVYDWWGYYGPIAVRSSLYFLLCAGVIVYFYRSAKRTILSNWLLAAVVCAYFVILRDRFYTVRPHAFSYLFLALFIFLLDGRSKWKLLLPILAVLWVNIHGIYYPVVLFVAVSYFIEYYADRARPQGHNRGVADMLGPALCIAAVFLTPYGDKLFSVPFTPMQYVSLVIGEFQSVPWENILSLEVPHGFATRQTLFNLTVFLAVIGAVSLLIQRRGRLSHFLLLAGAFGLLAKGSRFTNEFVLLVMPIIRDCFPPSLDLPSNWDRKMFAIAGCAGLIAVSTLSLYSDQRALPPRPRYPFSTEKLPVGVVAFLQRVGGEGSLLNDPNVGGFLEWSLYPKIKTFIDMQVPFLFSEDDFYTAARVFSSKQVFSSVINQYKPAFLGWPLAAPAMKIMADFPEYRLVFFDDVELLFADTHQRPDLAKYALNDLDPGVLPNVNLASMTVEKENLLLNSLKRMIAIDSDSITTRLLAARIRLHLSKADEALEDAEVLILDFPEMPEGYDIAGDAEAQLKRPDAALGHYRQALERTPFWSKTVINRKIGRVYFAQGMFLKALGAFQAGVNIYDHQGDLQDAFDFGEAAFKSGKKEEAFRIWKFLYEHRIGSDERWRAKLEMALGAFRPR